VAGWRLSERGRDMRQLGSSLQLKEGADMDGWMEIQWLKVALFASLKSHG